MSQEPRPAPWGLLEPTVRQAPKIADLPAAFNASLPSGKRLISLTAQSTASATPAHHHLSSPIAYSVALQDCELMHAWSAGDRVKYITPLGARPQQMPPVCFVWPVQVGVSNGLLFCRKDHIPSSTSGFNMASNLCTTPASTSSFKEASLSANLLTLLAAAFCSGAPCLDNSVTQHHLNQMMKADTHLHDGFFSVTQTNSMRDSALDCSILTTIL